MQYPSRIELSTAALRRNLGFLRRHLGPGALFSSVVKGNAYGHGIEAFVPLAERCGVRHFSVFSADEALRVVGCRTTDSQVAIMGFIDPEELAWAVEHEVSFYVFDPALLESALAAARTVGRPARVHLEVETGLNRTGLDGEALGQAVDLLAAHPDELVLDGVCTHFAGAESVGNHVRITRQKDRFAAALEDIVARGIRPRLRHAACSAAALTYPETIMDMARIGIAHYGYWPSQETRMHHLLGGGTGAPARDPLQRVLRWTSRVVQIKPVPAGEFVGYGTSYLTTRAERFAVVPVGYFHGYPRVLSNLGHVLVRGRRAPVAGMVNMNLIMVDVTDNRDVQVGDEVVVIGNQQRQAITVSSFSEMTRFLNYEVLARLPADLPGWWWTERTRSRSACRPVVIPEETTRLCGTLCSWGVVERAPSGVWVRCCGRRAQRRWTATCSTPPAATPTRAPCVCTPSADRPSTSIRMLAALSSRRTGPGSRTCAGAVAIPRSWSPTATALERPS